MEIEKMKLLLATFLIFAMLTLVALHIDGAIMASVTFILGYLFDRIKTAKK